MQVSTECEGVNYECEGVNYECEGVNYSLTFTQLAGLPHSAHL